MDAYARWLQPYNYPFPFDLDGSGWLSGSFNHAVRILHPAYQNGYPVTWEEIAATRGIHLETGISFYDVSGRHSPNYTMNGVFDTRPEQGSLPEHMIEDMYAVLSDAEFGLVWEGFRDPALSRSLSSAATVQNEATVYRAIMASRSPDALSLERSPSFWWPSSENWCAATGLDSYETLVASSAESVLDAIASIQGIEIQVLR